MNPSRCTTPLHGWHVEHGARMVEFGGWEMPIQYTTIVQEHQATRHHAALFDVSHMGRFELRGPSFLELPERVLSRKVADLASGRIRYSLVTGNEGGILDDVLIYHLESPSGQSHGWLVVNAANRHKIWNWLQDHRRPGDGELADRTLETAMIAVQGPQAVGLASRVLEMPVDQLGYYRGRWVTWRGLEVLVSRTGYTGEDGVELTIGEHHAGTLWERLLDAGGPDVRPAGLGARDTLRLEAGLPLYGHELTEAIDPFQAGLDFAVQLEGRSFPGADVLREIAAGPRPITRVGLVLDGHRPARQDYPIVHGQDVVGTVTSGTFSPTLDRPIAMGYVQSSLASPGTELAIEIRGQLHAARITPLPFYRRAST